MKLSVVVADITTLAVDVIVNAANPSLLGGGGVDGAIHRAAGPKLLRDCRELGGCEVGGARLTPGYDLPSHWVVHAVGPIWHGGAREEDRRLHSCYYKALSLTQGIGGRTIAFPGISTGVYGYPAHLACRVAIAAVRTWHQRNVPLDEVIFCCFSDSDAALYREALS